jgi:Glycine zipper
MLQGRMMLFGVAALAAVATAGWIRQPQAAAAASQGFTVPANSFTAPADIALDPAYATAPSMATPVSATAVPVRSGVYRTAGAPVAKLSPRAAQQSTRYRYSDPELQDDSRPATVVKQRSKTKSAVIIAGGAAAGAAVGGLAGGKKGAAIGALSGGAAGVVYDRMTHKKEQPAARSIDYDEDRSQGRSTAKSAVIVGGGAAAGAAIGGAAAGGKGAAIGALTGAGAGLIYDRMTKNR